MIPLPVAGPSVLALGAGLKNTVCVTLANGAQVSELNGDLDSVEARLRMEQRALQLLGKLRPEIVVHDMHPDFYSTQFALAYAKQHGLPTLAVQHHHAHIAAICAEHHITHPVLGLALDGVGLGSDGAPWGGELLCVTGADFQRIGHLAPLAMPGGDKAAIEPWRMAASVLHKLGRGDEITRRFSNQPGAGTVAAMLERDLNCPATSSMGRLFDAAAGLLGICDIQAFEAQAAIALEELAVQHGPVDSLADGFFIGSTGELDFSMLLAILVDCKDAAYGAALFHATLAEGLIAWVERAAQQNNLEYVALGGGCFHNLVLSGTLKAGLSRCGLNVLSAQQMLPNDSSISLGQAWIALQYLKERHVSCDTRPN